jgi:hypothetical protein
MIANLVQFTGEYELTSNVATATFDLSTITSGTGPCIATPSSLSTGYVSLASFGCDSSNTNSITGSGYVVDAPGNARFGSSGDIASTVTQMLIGPGLPQGEVMIGAGAPTGTHVLLSIANGHVKSTQTTVPAAAATSAAGAGATCTLADATDVAGTINLTTGSASFSTGAQCTVTFNAALTYGVAPICVWSPASATAAASARQIYVPNASTASFTVDFGSAEVTSTAYALKYHCIETQ